MFCSRRLHAQWTPLYCLVHGIQQLWVAAATFVTRKLLVVQVCCLALPRAFNHISPGPMGTPSEHPKERNPPAGQLMNLVFHADLSTLFSYILVALHSSYRIIFHNIASCLGKRSSNMSVLPSGRADRWWKFRHLETLFDGLSPLTAVN